MENVDTEEVVESKPTEQVSNEYATPSFNIDHRAVHAPYVRLADKKIGKDGCIVSKFDIRLCQPNKESLTVVIIHTLEHILSEILHTNLPELIDFSPMGCQTGFYLTIFGEPSEEDMAQLLVQAMIKVANWNKPIPAANEIQCGNCKTLATNETDFMAVKLVAKSFIGGIISKGYGA